MTQQRFGKQPTIFVFFNSFLFFSFLFIISESSPKMLSYRLGIIWYLVSCCRVRLSQQKWYSRVPWSLVRTKWPSEKYVFWHKTAPLPRRHQSTRIVGQVGHRTTLEIYRVCPKCTFTEHTVASITGVSQKMEKRCHHSSLWQVCVQWRWCLNN